MMGNRIKRAVIMAAGTGERMRPVTGETPKPLVKVNGVRMIDTAIRSLNGKGISEIYVVVGYLKEKFVCLEEEYPGVVLIENPYYAVCNNISSLYAARDYIEDAVILDGDQLICNQEILRTEIETSGYHAVWTERETDEWLLTAENGIITECSRNGGKQGWQLFSISYWTAEDGRKLKSHLETVFKEEQNRNLYWDDIALFCYPREYRLCVYPMNFGDVVEIDSLAELVSIDKSYGKYSEGERVE